MKRWEIVVPVVTVLILSGIGLALQEYEKNKAGVKSPGPMQNMETPRLANAFSGNDDAAGLLYKNKVISLKGRVLKVEHIGGIKNVVLGVEPSKDRVICQFQKSYKSEMVKVQPGQQISVKGIYAGALYGIVLVGCILQ